MKDFTHGVKPDNAKKKSVAIFFLHDPCCHTISWKILSSYLDCCLGISLGKHLKFFCGCKLFLNQISLTVHLLSLLWWVIFG